MAQEYTAGYCNNCQADRKLERKATNHILHFFITVVLGIYTAGIGAVIWIAVWILSSIKFGGWRCSACGSTNVVAKKSFNIMQTALIVFAIGIVITTVMTIKNNLGNSVSVNTTINKNTNNINAVNSKYDNYEINSVRQELSDVAKSDDMKFIQSGKWINNTFMLRANVNDNLSGYADYICENIVKNGRYDTAFGNSQIIHIKINDKNNLRILDSRTCYKK